MQPSCRPPMIDRSKDRLVRLPEVRSLTGLSTATIYRKMDTGQFRPKVRLASTSWLGTRATWGSGLLSRWVGGQQHKQLNFGTPHLSSGKRTR